RSGRPSASAAVPRSESNADIFLHSPQKDAHERLRTERVVLIRLDESPRSIAVSLDCLGIKRAQVLVQLSVVNKPATIDETLLRYIIGDVRRTEIDRDRAGEESVENFLIHPAVENHVFVAESERVAAEGFVLRFDGAAIDSLDHVLVWMQAPERNLLA